jgi:hypothetical protein
MEDIGDGIIPADPGVGGYAVADVDVGVMMDIDDDGDAACIAFVGDGIIKCGGFRLIAVIITALDTFLICIGVRNDDGDATFGAIVVALTVALVNVAPGDAKSPSCTMRGRISSIRNLRRSPVFGSITYPYHIISFSIKYLLKYLELV